MNNKPLAYIGIDPGAKGSIVCLYEELPNAKNRSTTLCIQTKILVNATSAATWEFLNSWDCWDCFACIEQQAPRPTRWFDKRAKRWQSSILRSTVVLYGSYMQLRGMLTASTIAYEDCPPQRWQKTLRLHKDKGMKDTEWKRLLKTKAQQAYPTFSQEITLATADALLMTHYVREKRLMYSLSNKKIKNRFHEEQEE